MAGYDKKRKRSSKASKKIYKKRKISKTSKKSYKKSYKKSTSRSPKQTGTGHWLSYGAGIVNKKRGGFLSKLDKMLPAQCFVENYNGTQLVSTTGTQYVNCVSNMFTPFTITNHLSTTAGTKTHFVQASSNTKFQNNCNAPVFLTIYDIVAKRDVHANDLNNLGPNYSWVSDPAVPANFLFMVGAIPYDSPQFCKYWTVLRTTRINLALGESCEHITSTKPNRIWDSSLNYVGNTTSDAANTCSWKGLTQYTMVVACGTPADSGGAVQGVGITKVDTCTTVRYQFAAINSTPDITSTAVGIATTAALDIMDTGTGASALIAVA
nr:MAG: capsid protein [Cressdnaviricota sp.]